MSYEVKYDFNKVASLVGRNVYYVYKDKQKNTHTIFELRVTSVNINNSGSFSLDAIEDISGVDSALAKRFILHSSEMNNTWFDNYDSAKAKVVSESHTGYSFSIASCPNSLKYFVEHDTKVIRCNQCGSVVLTNDKEDFPYQCIICDEDLPEHYTHKAHLHNDAEVDEILCAIRDKLLLDQ